MTINPYHPPSEAPAKLRLPPRTNLWRVRFCAGLMLLVLVIALAVEFIEHESIVITGPILFLVGLVLAIVAYRQRDVSATALGGSAMSLCVLIVFLINFNGWGPAQGDRPITILGFCYAAFAIPFGTLTILSRKIEPDVFDQ